MATVHVEGQKGPEGAKAKSASGQVPARESTPPRSERGSGLSRLLARDIDQFAQSFGLGPALSRLFAERWPFFEQSPIWGHEEAMFMPRANVYQKDNHLLIETDLPGMNKDDIKVEVTDDRIAISGTRRHESTSEDEGSYYRECSYGDFYRAFPLPEGAVMAKTRASFKHGVLKVSVPLAEEQQAKAHSVQIESGEDAPSKATSLKAD